MNKNICSECKIEKNGEKFYQSRNKIYFLDNNVKRMTICKDCFRAKISEDIIYTFKKYDLPFLYDVWFKCHKDIGEYMSQINSLPQYKNLIWKDSILDKYQNEPETVYKETNFYENIIKNLKNEAEKLNSKLEKIRDNYDMNLYIATLKSLKEILNLIKEYDWKLMYSEYGIPDDDGIEIKKQVSVWEQDHSNNIRNHKVWDIKIDNMINIEGFDKLTKDMKTKVLNTLKNEIDKIKLVKLKDNY